MEDQRPPRDRSAHRQRQPSIPSSSSEDDEIINRSDSGSGSFPSFAGDLLVPDDSLSDDGSGDGRDLSTSMLSESTTDASSSRGVNTFLMSVSRDLSLSFEGAMEALNDGVMGTGSDEGDQAVDRGIDPMTIVYEDDDNDGDNDDNSVNLSNSGSRITIRAESLVSSNMIETETMSRSNLEEHSSSESYTDHDAMHEDLFDSSDTANESSSTTINLSFNASSGSMNYFPAVSSQHGREGQLSFDADSSTESTVHIDVESIVSGRLSPSDALNTSRESLGNSSEHGLLSFGDVDTSTDSFSLDLVNALTPEARQVVPLEPQISPGTNASPEPGSHSLQASFSPLRLPEADTSLLSDVDTNPDVDPESLESVSFGKTSPLIGSTTSSFEKESVSASSSRHADVVQTAFDDDEQTADVTPRAGNIASPDASPLHMETTSIGVGMQSPLDDIIEIQGEWILGKPDDIDKPNSTELASHVESRNDEIVGRSTDSSAPVPIEESIVPQSASKTDLEIDGLSSTSGEHGSGRFPTASCDTDRSNAGIDNQEALNIETKYVLTGTALAVIFSSNGTDKPELITEAPTISPSKQSIRMEFGGSEELSDAVEAYQEASLSDSPESSEVAQLYGFPISTWDVSQITDFSRLFDSLKNESFDQNRGEKGSSFNEDLSGWDVSNAESMLGMFAGANEFEGIGLETWNVGKVKDFSNLFLDCASFDGKSIEKWNTSSATNLDGLFHGASLANEDLDLNNFDVSKVTTFSQTFAGTNFSGNVSEWDTSNAQSMSAMFYESSFSGDVSKWDTSKVQDFHIMFAYSSYNGDLSGWNVSLGTDFYAMFAESSFDGNISSWSVSNARDMTYMFEKAEFSGIGGIENWNVSNVLNTNFMFRLNKNFDESLCAWGSILRPDTDVTGMFENSACTDTRDPVLPEGPLCHPC